MTAAWKADLEDARRPPTVAQRVWDEAWHANWRAAVRRGRSPNDAIEVADTRTEAQRGQRPEQPKETT